MKLLLSQKNTLYALIEKKKLSPYMFEYNERGGIESSVTDIKYKGTDFKFSTMGEPSTSKLVQYSPGEFEYLSFKRVNHWFDVIETFQEWLSHLSDEIVQIDKWKRLDEQVNQINVVHSIESDKFSFSEVEEIQQKLLQLKVQLKTISLTTDQFNVLNEKIDHLTNLAPTLNKFDWYGLFIGTIVSIIIQLSVTPENAKALWSLIKNLFNSYFITT